MSNELTDVIERAEKALQARGAGKQTQPVTRAATGPTADLRARLPRLHKKLKERASRRMPNFCC